MSVYGTNPLFLVFFIFLYQKNGLPASKGLPSEITVVRKSSASLKTQSTEACLVELSASPQDHLTICPALVRLLVFK